MIKIITDSTSDIPSELVAKYDIGIIPLSIALGENEYKDGVDINQEEFYERLRRSNAFPQTNAPSIEDIVAVYKKYLDRFEQIVSIHISQKMSRTIARAEKAKKQLKVADDKIIILDSKSASFGLGLQVLGFAETYLGREKIYKGDVDNFKIQVIDKSKVIFGVPSLDLLKRGGRLGTAEELVGSLLGHKPILSVEDGEIFPKGKVKERKEFPQKIISLMKEDLQGKKRIKAGVFHWRSNEEVENLRKLINDNFECSEIYLTNASSVIGAHTGYGAVGATYYPID